MSDDYLPNPRTMDAAMSTETQTMTSVTPAYRRNGKLFSCEPCRRGKLRCDHNSPVCGRCARRNKPDQCVYHPAPLTKSRSSPASQRGSLPPFQVTTSRAYPSLQADRAQSGLMSPPPSTDTQQSDYSALRSVNAASLEGSSGVTSPSVLSMPPSLPADKRTTSSTSYQSPESSMSFKGVGFLGPTSYSAVFTENPGSLGIEDEDVADTPNLPPVTAEKIDLGAEVLVMLRELPLYERFSQRWFDLCDGIIVIQPVFRIWIEELWSEFGSLLLDGKPDQLRSLSELVWRNTRRPMKTRGDMTAKEWAKSASGRNLRWETVGIILSMAGLIAVNLSNWDTIFDTIRDRYIDRATFGERMRKSSEYCLCFCYESEVLNDIYIWFMYEDLILVEALKGDAHYAAWQRTGEVCDAIVAMGLHQGNEVDSETPFWLSEMRKKIFISAYGHDKIVATFLGRPPRLSHRYCKMECPLDLSDEQLFLEGPELDAVLSKLDANGWNTSGNLNRATWLRVWFQHCRVREDILEIALGSDEGDISYRAEQIQLRLQRLHASYPDFMKITPEEIFSKSDLQMHLGVGFSLQVNICFTLCIHAGIMHTEFLLLRALINKKQKDYKELIPISKRMLSIVLLAQSRRDFFRDFQGDLIYLLTVHGLPSAGVLAIELLKQEQSRQYKSDVLPRSETIQDLSVFISALASVAPGVGNFSICNQGRRALKRVLDQILSPQFPSVAASDEQPAFDEMSLFFPTGNDADFLQWLENVEWDKGNWSNTVPSQDTVSGP